MDEWYRWDGDDLILNVRIQPRASKDEFAGPFDEYYKIRIKAAPVDGKANSHLIGFLAKQFGVAKSRISLDSGETSRSKRLRIRNPLKIPLPIVAK